MLKKNNNSRSALVRFGVSLPKNLIEQFDELIQQKKYTNRSEAIRDLIRKTLVEEEINRDETVIGAVHVLYDHHKRELSDKLTEIQHNNHDMIISTTHVHLDHDNCLEVILLKGRAGDIKDLSDKMTACKGVKHGQLFLTSRGRHIG